jgi:hypothetical protein
MVECDNQNKPSVALPRLKCSRAAGVIGPIGWSAVNVSLV